jgi:signal transduction histidine kinase
MDLITKLVLILKRDLDFKDKQRLFAEKLLPSYEQLSQSLEEAANHYQNLFIQENGDFRRLYSLYTKVFFFLALFEFFMILGLAWVVIRTLKKLRLTNDQLTRELELREIFLATAAHDLKTPLTSMALNLELAKKKILTQQNGQTAQKTLQACQAQCRKLQTLFDRLLDLTQIETGQFQLLSEKMKFNPIIKQVIQELNSLAPAPLPLHFQSKVDLLGYWDPVRVRQVVQNLLANALRYGRGKPVVITIDLSEKKDFALLQVRDQGIGIAPEEIPRIFQKYHRAAAAQKGTSHLGLGLFITQRIIQDLGGRIEVTSQVGQGSTFTVWLPLNGPVI